MVSEPSTIHAVVRLLLGQWICVLLGPSESSAWDKLRLFTGENSLTYFALEKINFDKHEVDSMSKYVAHELVCTVF